MVLVMETNHSNTENGMSIHPFEKAGLGVAPFRFVKYDRAGVDDLDNDGQLIIRDANGNDTGARTKPGGTCCYCGQYIVAKVHVKDANGAVFHVGTQCAEKTTRAMGETKRADKLTKAFKANERAARKAREVARIEAAKSAGPDVRDRLDAEPHPTREGLTLRDWVGFMFANAGHTGQLKAARVVERYA